MNISKEFQDFVNTCAKNDWEPGISEYNLEVSGIETPVYKFWAGRNSTHEFYLCQEVNGPHYYRISAGPKFIEAADLTAEDLAYIEEIRKTRPYSCDDEIIMQDGKLLGLDKWVEHVTVCNDFATACNAYLGHY